MWRIAESPASYHSVMTSRLAKSQELDRHTGCVNSISWNEDGSKLVSGSDDRTVVIWGGYPLSPIIALPTGHRNNVFCATFTPHSQDAQIITCAADGCVHLLNSETGARDILYESESASYCFKHVHTPLTPESGLVTISDGSLIRFDIRTKSTFPILNIRHDQTLRQLSLGRFTTPPSGTALSFNPIDPFMFALGTSTKCVFFYDFRNLSTPLFKVIPEFQRPSQYPGDTEAVSGLCWDHRGRIIVNYCRQNLIEIDLNLVQLGTSSPKVGSLSIPRQWTGRVNHETFLKEVALLGNDQFVATGSDCGNIFIWERFGEQKLILKKKADPFILNCVAPHPELPLLATSGIANSVSIWEPINANFFIHRASSDVTENSVDEATSRLSEADSLRSQGNQLFHNSNYSAALAKYSELCDLLRFRCDHQDITLARRTALEKGLNNLAAALIQLGRWTAAIDACDEVLDMNTGNEKALFRRAKCYFRLGNLDMAISDIQHLLALNPENIDAVHLMDLIEGGRV